jgi:uncharacterized protein
MHRMPPAPRAEHSAAPPDAQTGPPEAQTGPAEAPHALPGQLWRAPRVRSLVALAALGGLAALVWLLAHAYTDLLWYAELGHKRVFWTTLKWKLLGQGLPAFGTAVFLVVNFAVVERVVAPHAPLRPYRRLAYPAAAIVAGILTAQWRVAGTWKLLALWAGRSDFGTRDPLFGRDVGYYVFSLPLQQHVVRWLLETLAIGTVATIGAYLAAGRLRRARTHLLALAALALLVLAWRVRLDQFALVLPHHGAAVPGATYTDVHVRVPAHRALVILAVAGAALCLYAARRPLPRGPTVLLPAAAVLVFVAQSALPSAIESFDVEPQQLTREKPYVADAIAGTRQAFALDDVGVRIMRSGDRTSLRDLDAARHTVANLALWDNSVLRPALNELQSISRYYSFPGTTVDRYAVNGRPRLLTVAPRQLDRSRLDRSWASDRFAYTHGYGAIAVRSGAVDTDGHPRLSERAFERSQGSLSLREPRVYYDERRDASTPYIGVSS